MNNERGLVTLPILVGLLFVILSAAGIVYYVGVNSNQSVGNFPISQLPELSQPATLSQTISQDELNAGYYYGARKVGTPDTWQKDSGAGQTIWYDPIANDFGYPRGTNTSIFFQGNQSAPEYGAVMLGTNSTRPVDITGWTLQSTSGSFIIPQVEGKSVILQKSSNTPSKVYIQTTGPVSNTRLQESHATEDPSDVLRYIIHLGAATNPWTGSDTIKILNKSGVTVATLVPFSNVDSPNTLSVPGMTQYTDTDFGFSFWYPSAWTAQSIDGDCSNAGDWGMVSTPSGGTGIRCIIIKDPKSPQWPKLMIGEISSASMSLRIDTSNTNDPLGIDERIFFDTNTHTWTGERYSTAPNGNPPGTYALNVSKNTMGGLHIFGLHVGRFTNESVIPLSAHNFVIVGNGGAAGPGPVSDQPLVQTIVALDPSVATPVSADDQVKMIQAEKTTYSGN